MSPVCVFVVLQLDGFALLIILVGTRRCASPHTYTYTHTYLTATPCLAIYTTKANGTIAAALQRECGGRGS